MESLEDRSMMTALTPAQAVVAINAQAAVVAQQTAQLQSVVQNIENGLLAVARQLDADNFSQIQSNTAAGNTHGAVAEMLERPSIIQAEQRITNEFTLIISELLAANATFKTQSAALVTAVSSGAITPTAAVAAQASDLAVYGTAATTAQATATADDQFELVNLSGLVYGVEGLAGLHNLGTFSGKFDVKAAGSVPGVLTDYQGFSSAQFTLSAKLLQGTFTAASTNYLQVYAGPSTSPLLKQPIVGGTITAAISPSPDALGYTIHGTILMQLGPVGAAPARSLTFQFEANLTGQSILIGNLMVAGQPVGSFNWMLH